MRERGLTLVELLMTLAIAAIVAGLALPGLQRFLADAAVSAAANQALAALSLARRTALSTGATTTVCPTADLQRCDFAGTEWMLFDNGPGGSLSRREGAERVLRRWPITRGVTVSGTRGYAAYLPQTRAAMTLTFTFCHRAYPALRRSVVVSQTGRARISFDATTSSSAPRLCP
jgi:type IV fimbrial biogenesis protein FimT